MGPTAMTAQQKETGESRTEKVAIAVTPTEKRAVRVIAGIRDMDESNLCRSIPIAEIVAEFERIRGSEQKEGA